MQLGSEFDRKKVKVLLCGSHLHFSIITVQMAFTCHCSVRMSGVIPLFQHLRRCVKRRLFLIIYCDKW